MRRILGKQKEEKERARAKYEKRTRLLLLSLSLSLVGIISARHIQGETHLMNSFNYLCHFGMGA